MRKALFIILALLLALFLWLYVSREMGKRISVPSAISDTIAIALPVSTFHIPISYPVVELQNFLNGKIAGKFLEVVIYPTKHEKDRVKVEIRKLNKIRIRQEGQRLLVTLPLAVKATILNSRINFITKGIKPVDTEVLLTLATPVGLDAGWNLVTLFKLQDIQWLKPPVITIAGIGLDLTQKIDETLRQHDSELTKLLDGEIRSEVSLDKPVGKIWEDLQKRIIISRNPSPLYLRFICEGIGGDFKLERDTLFCYTSIDTKVAIVSESMLQARVRKLPPFQQLKSSGRFSDIFVYAIAEFEVINHELRTALQGMTFEEKGISTTLETIKVFTSDSGLVVQATARGDVDGELVATGHPVFDPGTNKVTMKNFQFLLGSSSSLINIGTSILYDRIRDSVASKLVFGLDSLIRKIPSAIENAISKGNIGKAIEVDVEDMKIIGCDIRSDAKRMHVMVHTRFASAIHLKHLNAGKNLSVKSKGVNDAK